MAQLEIKYGKVWKVYEEHGIKKADIGDSSKNKDGSYSNWTWFGCALFGKDIQIEEGAKVHARGLIEKTKRDDGKYFENVKIFEVETVQGGNAPKAKAEELVEIDDLDSGLPF